ncbi:hypothetical protein SAMN05421805_103484 [Saccharopolyspora antimicrobica]|uniref:Uncharacterized protein n=1 Tax=Saccharopolyspora antimicrobica TaxID=455193 RepID=A0A1I4XKJ0_9PSEU|nr:hypothetical protein [Saccharopolyspora antimicrobica]RKT84550.1 hypothetical protein ATL45_2868 [Saccharopolyspora antimicrobica]SFN26354.1 hypothetical protein SAMN05421805_103484 [Saccharopolyspora antimicrobica]
MRTVFIHGEADRFEAAREELIARFGRSRPELDATELLDQLLTDKFARDGLLAWWSEEELARFLVAVVPRRSVLADWSLAPDFLHQWIGFLAENDLLTGPNTVSELHEAVERATPDHLIAMAEPAEWSSEKFWSITMRELGVDTEDPQAVAEFFAAVDADEVDVDHDVLEEIERREALEPGDQPALWLPPVELTELEPHRAIAAGSPVVQLIHTVLEWIGDGRDPSDVDELVAALGGHAEDADLLLEWAERAGLVRPAGDLLVRTLIADPLLARPELLWSRLWQRFVLVDDVFRERLDVLSEGADALPEIVQAALSVLYARTDAVPLELIVSMTCDLLDEAEPAAQEAVRDVVGQVLAQWESMQAIRTHTTAPGEVEVELLPAGLWAARESLRAFGFRVPSVDDLASAPAELLALALTDTPADVQPVLIGRWIEQRGTRQASGELAALLRRVDDPTVRLSALAVLEHTGAEGVAAARELIDDPVAGPAARVWLQARPSSTDAALRLGDELLCALDGMAAALDEDIELFLTEFGRHPASDQLSLITEIAGSEHSSATEVLTVIAEHHPEEVIATAARTGLGA